MTMMHHITLSNGVFAACGVVCKSDPTPSPSPREGRHFTDLPDQPFVFSWQQSE